MSSCRDFGCREATLDDDMVRHLQISHCSTHGIIQDRDGFHTILSSGILRHVVH